MRTVTGFLFALLLIMPAWAGTWRESFEDADLGEWSMNTVMWVQNQVTPNVGNWQVVDGAVTAGDNNAAKRYDLYAGLTSWTDYTAEVSVKLSKPMRACSTTSGVWLGVRYQRNGLNDYAVGLYQHNGSEVAVSLIYAGGWPNERRMVVFATEADTWYRLKIQVAGKGITCSVDDVEVDAFQDGTFSSGFVVLAVNGIEATFDDFVVTGHEIPDGGPSGPDSQAVKATDRLCLTWADLKNP